MISLRTRIALAALILAGVVALAITGSWIAALGIAAVAGFTTAYGRRRAAR